MEASTVEAPRNASVYICKNGHRTVAFWSVPATCSRKPVHSQPACGLPIVPLADAPADAKEKMLNPLKASKKASAKKK